MEDASAPGSVDYDYPDDFTETSEDHDLLLPGLDVQPALATWRGGDDWLLPGGVSQLRDSCSGDDIDDVVSTTSSRANPADAADAGGTAPGSAAAGGTGRRRSNDNSAAAGHRADGYTGRDNANSHTPSAADDHHHHDLEPTWLLRLGGGGPLSPGATRSLLSPSSFGSPARDSGGGGGGGGGLQPQLHQVRLLPTTQLRSSAFLPFGSSSLQHRDSLTSSSQHPLALTVRHHPLLPQSPTRQQQQQQQRQQQLPLPEEQPQPVQQQQQQQAAAYPQDGQLQRAQQREREVQELLDLLQPPRWQGDLHAGAGSVGFGGGGGAIGGGGGPAGDRGGGDASGAGGGRSWLYVGMDPFAPTRLAPSPSSSSSSSSSLLTGSRDVSPSHRSAGPLTYVPQPPPGGRVGQPSWLASRSSQYGRNNSGNVREAPAGAESRVSGGILVLGREGIPDASEGPLGRRAWRPLVLDVGHGGGGGINLESLAAGPGSPASSQELVSPAAGHHRHDSSSNSSWTAEDEEANDMFMERGLPAGDGGQLLPMLWPMGRSTQHPSSSSPYGMTIGTSWQTDPGGRRELPHQQVASRLGGGSGGSVSWRPPRGDLMTEEDTTWDHHFGGLSSSRSFGLGITTTTTTASTASTSVLGDNTHRYSPGSSQSGGAALGPLGSSAPMGSTRGAAVSASYLTSLNPGAGADGNSPGGTRCFTSLDPAVGPQERRSVVLTSAHRRPQPGAEPVAPGVRQYSEGLAGMLTNAQIQEWMSQHASRLLLPRHMHDIADIVFRPPSAVPEKKPPKCQPSPVTLLPPPVVLGGRYPPPHVSRLASDTAFMASLLGSLPGVDPAAPRLQAVVTALQGRDVALLEEGAEGQQQQQPLQGQHQVPLLQRLGSKAVRPGSARLGL